MIKAEEVIQYYTNLKQEVAQIKDPNQRRKIAIEGLGKYNISQWCEVGRILRSANLI